MKIKSFSDYKSDASNWITLAGGEYYPDILENACALYKPVLVLFGQLVKLNGFLNFFAVISAPCK
ncbi:MAG: hypothetical protein LBL13_01930 [Bacteroidales bacterium]|nr:hypothetical protein [Bacteroidales bacterium]